MRLEYYSGTEAFGNDVLEPLLRHEEQNNLLISFARNDRKAETSGWLLATVKDDAGSVLLTAACTPPFNLVLAETDNRPCPAAVKLLASELKTTRRMFPGVLAEQTLARRFAEEFAGTGRYRINHSMTVMRLDRVANHTPSPGAARPLREEDLFFVPYWSRAFAEEAHVGQPGLDASIEQTRKRIGADTFYLWEDRIPVSQACHARSTMHGAAISAVYTPLPYRGRGYASSLVAELSRVLLERGNRFCCLFADTANPVSCGIYRRIGYVDRCIVEELQWLP
jgi:acetyltransferase, GNAT family